MSHGFVTAGLLCIAYFAGICIFENIWNYGLRIAILLAFLAVGGKSLVNYSMQIINCVSAISVLTVFCLFASSSLYHPIQKLFTIDFWHGLTNCSNREYRFVLFFEINHRFQSNFNFFCSNSVSDFIQHTAYCGLGEEIRQ